MHAAIQLPRFALQAVLRARPQARRAAVAVLDVSESPLEQAKADQQRLLHVNAEAERHGIHAGMGAGMAMARCARLVLLHRSAEAESAAQEDVLECAAQWTPWYETTAPGLCVLDVSRVHQLADRLEACGRGIHERLAARHLKARIGFAEGADLAVLAAHAAEPVLIWRDAEADGATFLRALPVSALNPAPDTAELLRLWGRAGPRSISSDSGCAVSSTNCRRPANWKPTLSRSISRRWPTSSRATPRRYCSAPQARRSRNWSAA
jgi:protein ImuB